MLRISCQDTPARPRILKLEGRLSGPWVDELDRVMAVAASPPGGVVLDLSGVTFADARGVGVLRELAERGVWLQGCSPFLTELLDGVPR